MVTIVTVKATVGPVSSLLRVILGQDTASRGRILLDGEPR